MEEHDSGCEFINDTEDSPDIVIRRRAGGGEGRRKLGGATASGHRKTMLINNNDDLVRIAEELYSKDLEKCKENQLSVSQSDRDKGGGTDLRRHSSGYYSTASDQGGSVVGSKANAVTKKESVSSRPTEFSHVRPRVDTGLKKATSLAGSTVPRPREPLSSLTQKRSDPVPPSQTRKGSNTFKVPELPSAAGGGSFNRNSANRRSWTRPFGRNSDKNNKKSEKSSSEGIKTPFGEVNKPSTSGREVRAGSEEKRNQFSSKRSLTSLSLFSKKEEDKSEVDSGSQKERKNSFGRLRSARSSLDLSSLGFGSLSRASSKVALTDLKEESDSNSTVKSEGSGSGRKLTDRPWFDLTRVWKDQTRDLPADDMFHKMRKERSIRAKTVPSRLGSLESSSSVTDLSSLPSQPSPSVFSQSPPALSQAPHTPSTLKKTVHLLSPEVLTNWYEKRKRVENLYGPRRNSISNLFFNQDKKQSSPLVELRNGEKLRKSMLNLEDLLSGGGEGGTNQGSGSKGVQRSESAKLTNERHRWRPKGIQRSESARLINMRGGFGGGLQGLQPRQNSHPNLVHQLSCSSSSSSLADRSSLESPSKLTTCSLSATDPGPSPPRHGSPVSQPHPARESDSDLEADADPPDWRLTINKEELAKLSSKELKRQDVINELFHTERTHVRNLKVLDSVFRRPLLETGRMPRELVDRLFPNLEDVINLHQRFNTAMKLMVKQAGFPVGDICDILADMFLEGHGAQLVSVGGKFTLDQNSTIEELMRMRARDAKLEQFLTDIERNPACRRLQLQAILPCEHQRLVKYPLLLEQVAKYTDRGKEDSKELDTVKSAKEQTKEILESIDRLVAEQQNMQRLAEIQSNLDTSGLDKMGVDHVIFQEYRFMDLTQHVLIHDGSLTMKLGETKRVKALHVVLLQDCMVMLQKQGDKYLLKFHSSSASQGMPSTKDKDDKDMRRQFHSPIIKFSTMLVRPVATDKRAFYLINTTNTGPQIYELLASSGVERNKWIKYITEASHAYKCRESGMPKTKSEPEEIGASDKTQKPDLRSQSFREQTDSPRMERTERQNSSPPEGLNIEKKEGEIEPGSIPSPKKRMQRVEILKIVDAPPMIEPCQVQVSSPRVLLADPIVTPFEKLRQKDEEVSRILEEKQRLISDILHIPDDEFDTLADMAANNSGTTKDPKDILLAALAQAKSLTSFVNSSLRITEEDLVARTSPAKDDRSLALGPVGDQLVSITTSMNQHLTDLLALMQERDEERELLKRELAKSQEQVRGIFSTRGGHNTSSRPCSFISLGSDPGESMLELSDSLRPQSLLSFSSVDTADLGPIADSEEDTHDNHLEQQQDLLDSHLIGICEVPSDLPSTDIDLTPTEEMPSSPPPQSLLPVHQSSPIDPESEQSKLPREWTPEGEDVLETQ